MRSVLVVLLLSFFTVSSVSACQVAAGTCAPGMIPTNGTDGCQTCIANPKCSTTSIPTCPAGSILDIDANGCPCKPNNPNPKCPSMGATVCAPGTSRVKGADGCPTCKKTDYANIFNSASSYAPQALALGFVALAAALF